jgi:hypothetical protein
MKFKEYDEMAITADVDKYLLLLQREPWLSATAARRMSLEHGDIYLRAVNPRTSDVQETVINKMGGNGFILHILSSGRFSLVSNLDEEAAPCRDRPFGLSVDPLANNRICRYYCRSLV